MTSTRLLPGRKATQALAAATVAAWLALGPASSLAQPLPASDPCSSANCPAGSVCYQGACFEEPAAAEAQDACAAVECPAGKFCHQGACFDVELSAPELIPVPSSNPAPPAAILRVPVRISRFPGAPDGETDDPVAEIRCQLLDAQGSVLGYTPEFMVPPIAAGGGYEARLAFEADLNRPGEDGTVASYRCTMNKVVGSGLLCAEPFAGEGSVCEVSGPLVLP